MTRENALVLGGPAAAILQIAWPPVARGVAAHSDFRGDTLGRLRRTLDAVYTVTFGDAAARDRIGRAVAAQHARVRGTGYSAFDPASQLWVLATLIALSVACYERFVSPLAHEEKECFLRDMRVFGETFGLHREAGPQGWQAFTKYYHAMLADEQMGSLEISRELAWHIARPTGGPILRLGGVISHALAAEFLPEPIRGRLGFAPAPGWIGPALGTLQKLLPFVPPCCRFCRHYRLAIGR
jgi:uncharacterized protein (DUF2236 family)